MKKRNWLLLPIFLVLCVIWGNSAMPGDVSGSISGGLLEWLIKVFPFLNWLPEYLLRKIGHFSEFAALGFLLAWYFADRKGKDRVLLPAFLSMLAANLDETIQLFVPGRYSSLADVWIDSLGACAGIALLLLGYTVFARKKAN